MAPKKKKSRNKRPHSRLLLRVVEDATPYLFQKKQPFPAGKGCFPFSSSQGVMITTVGAGVSVGVGVSVMTTAASGALSET